MPEENKEAQKPEEADTSNKKKRSISMIQMIIIILLVTLLALGGFIAWKLLTMPEQAAPVPIEKSKEPTAAPAGPGLLVDVDKITVNLADEDQSRFLRITIKLGVKDEASKAKVEAYSAQIKDLIIGILSNKTFSSIRTANGKYNLKDELIYRINTLLGSESVESIFFATFIAQ